MTMVIAPNKKPPVRCVPPRQRLTTPGLRGFRGTGPRFGETLRLGASGARTSKITLHPARQLWRPRPGCHR